MSRADRARGIQGNLGDLLNVVPQELQSPETLGHFREQHDKVRRRIFREQALVSHARDAMRRAHERDPELPAPPPEPARDLEHWRPNPDRFVADVNKDRRCAIPDPEWRPLVPALDRPLRRAMYGVRRGIRGLQEPRVQACGRAVVSESGEVTVIAKADGRVCLSGLAHCHNIHTCPTCSMRIMQGRAAEIRAGVERWGADRVGMLTFTVRHRAGDSLKSLQRGLARAYAAFGRHRRFRAWVDAHGLFGRVRAFETTHGDANGWHPHYHALFLFNDPIPVTTTATKQGPRFEWEIPEWEELVELWQDCVERTMGAEHRPSKEHAVAATVCRNGDYIAKMGIEVADPGNKQGRKVVRRFTEDGRLVEEHHRTPMQLASDLAEALDHADVVKTAQTMKDAALWRAYRDDVKGVRRIVWSKGLKAALSIPKLTDRDLLTMDEEVEEDDVELARIPVAAWRGMRDRRTRDGTPAALYLIQVAEAGGAERLRKAILEVAAGEC